MRKGIGILLVALVTSAWGWPAAAEDKSSASVAAENKELKNEVRLLETQLNQVTKRLDAVENRIGVAPAGASAPTAEIPSASAAAQAAGAPPPGVTAAGQANPPPGVTVGSAVKSLLPGQVTAPTSFAAGYTRPPGAEPQQGVIIPSIQGVPQVFLPDISVVGDFTFQQDNLRPGDPRYAPANDKFTARDTQIIFFSPIDPYTSAQISIDKPFDGAFAVEEAFVTFNKLPFDLTVRAGQFRPQFGLINQTDTFQLPMANRPEAIAEFISQDGFVEPGVNVNGYIPNPWDLNLKADFNLLSGVNMVTYDHRAGQNFDFLYMGTLAYSRDFLHTGSLATGVSVAGGPGQGGQAYLVDPFLQLQYAPTQRNIWSWSVESLIASRAGVGDHGVKRGIYSLLDWNFWLRYHAGFLIDVADVPNVASGTQLGLSPILTYFVSGNTRLRLQYTHETASGAMRAADAAFLQLTFSLGNLKPLD